MERRSYLRSVTVAAAFALLLLVPAAASAQATTTASHDRSSDYGGGSGAAFTMSNAVAGNTVISYLIGPTGALTPAGNFTTGGTGTGVSLADQGSLVLTSDHRFLFVVNAGDNTVSVFAVNHPSPHGPLLTLLHVVGSGGVQPVSITAHGPLVYVLNAGNATNPGNIDGFFLGFWGQLFPLPRSSQPLSSAAPTGPAEIAFNPSGTVLVVTEKGTSLIDAYPVSFWGIAQPPVISTSNGSTPYGFAFSAGGSLIVSDAGPGALSSYSVAHNGHLTVVSGSIPDFQAAPCWVAVSGSYVYTTDAHSNTISTYQVAWNGALTLLASDAATTAAADTDMAIAGSHGQFLLVYDAGAGEIQEFSIGHGGSLALVATASMLPATAEGMAAF
ncbi:MAG TPA: 3-carboxymuconate cyclase [Thermoplasmata archaeon]|nr:3-carboxymuconate cyclase [Thermoplasmata archaeon]